MRPTIVAEPHRSWFAELSRTDRKNPMVSQYLLQMRFGGQSLRVWMGSVWTRFPMFAAILVALARRPRRIYPQLTTIGEVFHPDASVTSFFCRREEAIRWHRYGVNTVFDYPMYFVLRDCPAEDMPVGRIADVLRHDALYPRRMTW